MKRSIAEVLNKLTPLCWPDLVSYFMGYINLIELWSRLSEYKGCVQDSIDDGACYCGKFVDGKRYCKKQIQELENKEA